MRIEKKRGEVDERGAEGVCERGCARERVGVACVRGSARLVQGASSDLVAGENDDQVLFVILHHVQQNLNRLLYTARSTG